MKYILGFDFDNTLVSYDELMFARARGKGWVDDTVAANKKEIRDHIRRLPKGEEKWQKLQAYAYGRGMKDAQLVEGVKPFIEACRQAEWQVVVISHKTQFASMDRDKKYDLREKAMEWMEQNQFFSEQGLGLKKDQVFFEETRSGKIARIRELGCTHFIDDLEETFAEPDFPQQIEKLLFAPFTPENLPEGVRRFSAWEELREYFFAAARP